MAQRGGPVNPQFVSLDEYDCLVYPGFLRRTVRAQAVTFCSRALPLPLLEALAARCALSGDWKPRRPASRLGACSAGAGASRRASPENPPRTALWLLRSRRASFLTSLSRLRCPSLRSRLPPLFSQMARWNEDGSCAATARMRNGKGEPFTLTLSKAEIDDDLARLNAADPARR
jgi:hypothetical protein